MTDKEERILITKCSSHCHALRVNCDPFDCDDGMYCDKSGKWVRITEKFPAFIELGPCQRGADVFADRPDKTALEALERVAHANEQLSRWFGKCEMRACCAAYETRFLEMNRPAPIFNPDQLSCRTR